jgi:exopolyphosphatase/pppGpp-phosphohydrolase
MARHRATARGQIPGNSHVMSRHPVNLRLDERSTLLEFEDSRTVTLNVGPQGLADTVLQHDPPTPAELERAIDLVEDALGGLHRVSAGTGLLTADALLLALPGPGPQGGSLTRDAVELLFQRLASRALGTPVPADELPQGREIAAALLILRECMHHLDFDRVDVLPA